MEAKGNIDNIISQIKALSFIERISILEKIVLLLKEESKAEEQIKLTSLNGLGSEIWNKTNLDEYVENERQWD